jgi:LuxR family transcriptional regulator, maltose regulon positive regulatory protein
MREVDEVFRLRPRLGTLVEEAGEMQARLAKEGGPSAQEASSLTAAELRVLPMLATHLSFRGVHVRFVGVLGRGWL